MKSRITIEVDFDNNNLPVIQILQYPDSSDVRDRLLKHFTQLFGGSSWCKILWKGGGEDFNRIHISPIPPEQFKEQSEMMLKENERHQNWLNNRESVSQQLTISKVKWNKNHAVLLKSWIDKMLMDSGLAKIRINDSVSDKFLDIIDEQIEQERERWVE